MTILIRLYDSHDPAINPFANHIRAFLREIMQTQVQCNEPARSACLNLQSIAQQHGFFALLALAAPVQNPVLLATAPLGCDLEASIDAELASACSQTLGLQQQQVCP